MVRMAHDLYKDFCKYIYIYNKKYSGMAKCMVYLMKTCESSIRKQHANGSRAGKGLKFDKKTDVYGPLVRGRECLFVQTSWPSAVRDSMSEGFSQQLIDKY